MRLFLFFWIWISPGIFLSAQVTDRISALEWLSKGDSLVQQEDYPAAYQAFEQSLSYFEKTEEAYYHAYLLLWMGEAVYYNGEYHECIRLTRKSQDIATASLSTDTLEYYQMLLQNLGVFYSAIGDFDRQMDYYEQAFEHGLRQHGKNSTQAADAYTSLGVAFGRRGRWETCYAYVDTALQISESLNYDEGKATAYLILAHVFSTKKDFARAIDFQKQALKLAESTEEIARGHNNLGTVYTEVGDFKQAEFHLNRSLELRKQLHPSWHDNLISTTLNQVWLYFEAQELEKASIAIDQIIAASINRSDDYTGYLKLAYNYKAVILLEQGNVEEAEKFARKAIALEGGRLGADGNSLLVFSNVLLDQQAFEEAITNIELALENEIPGFKATTAYDNPKLKDIAGKSMVLDFLETKGRILTASGINHLDIEDFKAALSTYLLADSLIVHLRNTYQSEMSKEMLSADVKEIYSGAMNLLFHLHEMTGEGQYLEQAFAFSEKNKSLLILEQLKDWNARSFFGIPDEIVQKERALLQDIEFYATSIQANRNYVSSETLEKWEHILFTKRQEQETLLNEVRISYPHYYELKHSGSIASIQQVQEQLIGEGEVLIEFFLSDSWLYAFIISRKEALLKRVPAEKELNRQIADLRTAILNQEDTFLSLAHHLYGTILQPFLTPDSDQGLVLIPDGILGYIPFEALLTKHIDLTQQRPDFRALPYLIRDHEVRYYFSAGVALQSIPKKKKVWEQAILAFAPSFNGGIVSSADNEVRAYLADLADLAALRGTQEEVALLKERYKGKFFNGDLATEENFRKMAPHYGVLHIATHALIDDQTPSMSRLVFAPSDEIDQFLYAYELYGMQLKAKLVTLSACNTGYGQLKQGEGIASLARAFAFAGAPNLVMSLWQVRDKTTPELMQRFYGNLNEGMDKGTALHKAKLDFIDNYNRLFAHPYYWAGFIYTGNQESVLLAEASPLSMGGIIWYAFLILLLLAIIFYGKKWRSRVKEGP